MGIAAERFASLLRQLLAEGNTQQWIADRIGVHQTHVGRLARGARTPGLDVVESTLALAGVAGDYLFAQGPSELDYHHYKAAEAKSVPPALADFERSSEWSTLSEHQQAFLRSLTFPPGLEPTLEAYRSFVQALHVCVPADEHEGEEQTGTRVKRGQLEQAVPELLEFRRKRGAPGT